MKNSRLHIVPDAVRIAATDEIKRRMEIKHDTHLEMRTRYFMRALDCWLEKAMEQGATFSLQDFCVKAEDFDAPYELQLYAYHSTLVISHVHFTPDYYLVAKKNILADAKQSEDNFFLFLEAVHKFRKEKAERDTIKAIQDQYAQVEESYSKFKLEL